MSDLPDVLTLSEVAKILRCSKAHVCKSVNGQVCGITPIPAIRIGRRKLVLRTTLMQWIAANESALGGTMVRSSEVGASRRA